MKDLTHEDIIKSLCDLFEHGLSKDDRPIGVQLIERVKEYFNK